jgi:diaminopimelate decarboxylase
MSYLHYQNSTLYLEKTSINAIAERFGTPCYIYSQAAIEDACHTFKSAFSDFSHLVCYAVKANSNVGILNLFANHGLGFDIVSQGELERVLAAGASPQKIVFSGVAKTEQEIDRALEVGIFCFNVESEPELHRIHSLALKKNKIAAVTLRVNPNIDANTHPYIATGLHENKFGMEAQQILALCQHLKTMPHLKLIGIGCHLGSQITELGPFLEAIDYLIALVKKIEQENEVQLEVINLGGGLGITYQDESPPSIPEYVAAIQHRLANCPYKIIVEPGRAMIGNAGLLLTRVEYLKQTPQKNFAIVDAGMNDLIRPALYQAWHNIIPATLHPELEPSLLDVVGPVCESADFLGQARTLAIQPGDILAVCSAGAYGFSMSSNYNSRPRPAEVLISQDKMRLLQEREGLLDLFLREKIT